MFRSIMVPLDGSTFGEHALPWALALAERARASMQVVHVHVPLAPMYAERRPTFEDTLDPTIKQRRRAYLEALVLRLNKTSGVPVTSTLLEGAVGETLQQFAVAAQSELVVMTTHGRGPLARAWLGSVADHLVRHLSTPILLVRPGDRLPDPGREPNLQKMLIPLDGSGLAEHILEPATDLAGLTQAEITLFRVVQPMVIGNYAPSEMGMTGFDPGLLAQLQKLHDEDRSEAQAYLDKTAERLRARSLKVQTRLAVHDQPAVAILDEIKASHIDLVALETHGRTGLSRLFLGSVADKVLRGTSTAVLVHRPPVS